jgi:asparagine synthase (glutamine-hydrolysing)
MSDSTLAAFTRVATPVLTLGSPRFADARLAALAREQGDAAAWQAALTQGAQQAAAAAEGDFAVGLTDAAGRSFLAVDRFAVCTLCYRIIDGCLHFAARADELAALAPRAEIDPQAIFDYLYFHVIPSPRTIFQGVYRLPPAHCARFEDGKVSVTPYWVPQFTEPDGPTFEPLAAEFRQCVRDAVAAQLDGSKPACFLSGGTDSSTVAGMIGEVTGRPAATYSIGFEAEGYDEMQFARIAAQRFGTEHHEYYVTPDDLVRSIPAVAVHYDQPFGNSSALPAFYCAQMARDDGVTKLLAADGGDELFGGNSRYAKQRIFGWYDAMPAALRKGLLEPLLERTPLGALPLARKGRSYVEQAKVPLPDRMQMTNLLLHLGVDKVFTAEFLARVDLAGPLRQQRSVWQQAPGASALNRMLAYDWRYTLAEADLPKVCGTTQLASVAVRFPFLDPRLVDFSLRLPTAYKLKGLKLRWFFKEALRGFLPDEILAKKKQGFGLPFGAWANRHAGLHKLV